MTQIEWKFKQKQKRIDPINDQITNILDNFGQNKPSEFYPNTLPPTLTPTLYIIYIYIPSGTNVVLLMGGEP